MANKVVDEIEMEVLISLVESNPEIWDKSSPEHNNRSRVQRAWKRICAHLWEDFERWEDQERQEIGRLLVKKWNNVKDSWKKWKRKEKMFKKAGSGPKRPRPYMFCSELSFLEKNLEAQRKSPSAETQEEADVSLTRPPEVAPTTPSRPQKIPKKGLDEFEQSIIRVIEQPENRHLSFFKGIIPHLARFSESQVVDFQLGVLSLVKHIGGHPPHQKHNRNHPFPPYEPPYLPPRHQAFPSAPHFQAPHQEAERTSNKRCYQSSLAEVKTEQEQSPENDDPELTPQNSESSRESDFEF